MKTYSKKLSDNLITDFVIKKTKLFFDKIKTKNSIDIKNKTLAIAYSSGVDSSALFYTMLKLKDIYGIKIVLLHVNYNLREIDSIKDKLFAEKNARENNTEIFVNEVNNKKFENKNTQLLAREIRYNFFNKLHKEKKFDYLLTAHHKDDLVETLIFRMCKGSGTEIIKSMKSVNKYILRPFIDIYKKDILEYVKINNICYREDVTNKKNKYKRNKIRNVVIPLLEEINTNAKENIIDFCEMTYTESNILRKKVDSVFNKITEGEKINIKELGKYNETIKSKIIKKLFYMNKTEITKKRIEETKKIIISKKPNIKLLLDGKYLKKEYDFLYFSKANKDTVNIKENISIDKDGIYKFFDISIEVRKLESTQNINLKDGNLYLDINYPIIIRSRKEGDYIKSFPEGKKMKIKKLFIEKKIAIEKRESVPIIEKDGLVAAVCFNFLEEHKFSLNRVSSLFSVKNNKECSLILITLI